VTRAYININGNLSHIVAFRITPDITRETNTASALTAAQSSGSSTPFCRPTSTTG
jgi:hypothetical protein